MLRHSDSISKSAAIDLFVSADAPMLKETLLLRSTRHFCAAITIMSKQLGIDIYRELT